MAGPKCFPYIFVLDKLELLQGEDKLEIEYV